MTQDNKIDIEFDRSGSGLVIRAMEQIEDDKRMLIWSHAPFIEPLTGSIPSGVVLALINEVQRLRETYEPDNL